MIAAFLTSALGWLKGIPWQIYAAIAIAAGVYFYGEHRYDAGYEKREAEQAELDRKAAEKAREADAEAGAAIDATRNEVEQGNERARDAANGSDDPLGDGLRSLRPR